MTHSTKTRQADIERALLTFMGNLHDSSILEVFIEPDSHDTILPTTWNELIEQHLLRETNVPLVYTLSGEGWIMGLLLRSEYGTPQMREMAGKLCKTLKGRLKDRKQDEMATVDDVAAESGLPSAFIRNAIEANLIERLFDVKGASWASPQDRGRFINIPNDFKCPFLTS